MAVVNEHHHVVGFAEKPPLAGHESKLVSCGIYCLDPALLSRFPRNSIYDFGAHLIPDMVQRREHIFCYETGAYWCDIGDLQTLKDANLDVVSGKITLDLLEPQVRPSVWIAPDAEVAASAHLEGPLIVGSGARLAEGVRVIGPAVIGPGSELGTQAWLVRSVLLPGSRLADATMLADGLLGPTCLLL